MSIKYSYVLSYIYYVQTDEGKKWAAATLSSHNSLHFEEGTDFCTLKKDIKDIKRKVNVFCTYFYHLMTMLFTGPPHFLIMIDNSSER